MNARLRKLAIATPVLLIAGFGFLLQLEADSPDPEPSLGWTLTTWNDLGMHCMDEDYSVFAILPPFNTLNAELIDKSGKRVAGLSRVGSALYFPPLCRRLQWGWCVARLQRTARRHYP